MNQYPADVYTWNHYDGESPDMTSTGLPLMLADADLPTSIPSDGGDDGSLPYSPGLLEMGAHGGTHSAVPPSTSPVAANVPAKPSLWSAVGNAVFGGAVQVQTTNSTKAVASGANTTINTDAK